MHLPSPLDIQEAADMLVRTLARSATWKDTPIAIVGGAALQHHLTQPCSPALRVTNVVLYLTPHSLYRGGISLANDSIQNIDIIVRHSTQDSLTKSSLIREVLQCDQNRFFTYKQHDGGLQTETGVLIRFCGEDELCYQPSGFLPLVDAWRRGIMPYVPVEDLLVHKVTSAPLRRLVRDRYADAEDALFLVRPVQGIEAPKIRLSGHQRTVISECLGRFAEYSDESEDFWREILQI